MTPNQLPPLPAADHRGPNGTGAYFDSFTAAQMHTYALAALAQQAQPVDELPDLNPEDFVVAVVFKQLGGFAPVTAHGVRVTHKPSRISVVVDSERSQHKNRQLALQALRSIISEEFKS